MQITDFIQGTNIFGYTYSSLSKEQKANISFLLFHFSYAREWQAKLRELQESTKLNKNNSPRRSPSKDSNSPLPLPPGLNIHGPTPSVSITPSKRSSPPFSIKGNPNNSVKSELSPIKMDSNGALNLVSSPSPPSLMTELTSASADSPTSRRSPTLPQNVARPQVNYGVEMCVVCGDRASGK